MLKIVLASASSALCLSFAFPAFALDPGAIEELEHQIELLTIREEAARSIAAHHGEGLIGSLATARAETIALTRDIIEARLAAEEAGVPIEIVMPAASPDPERAAAIEAEIARQIEVIAEAEAEARQSGGLIQAVALSRVEAEKLTLARLRGQLLEARFGAILPVPTPKVMVSEGPEAPSESPRGENGKQDEGVSKLAWADPDQPEVDYSREVFGQLHAEGYEISGWWAISREQAAIDDSPSVLAMNVSAFPRPGEFAKVKSLVIRCSEGEASVVYNVDDYLLTNVRQNGIDVTFRIDEKEALTERWSELTSGEGAGIFGRKAEAFMREIYDAEKIFLRVVERDGERHDTVFPLAGIEGAIDAAAAACGFSTLSLTRQDYQAIQEMLNAGGFDAGTPDGIWGEGSKSAMRRFQESQGLEPTGAPDRKTLAAMGVER